IDFLEDIVHPIVIWLRHVCFRCRRFVLWHLFASFFLLKLSKLCFDCSKLVSLAFWHKAWLHSLNRNDFLHDFDFRLLLFSIRLFFAFNCRFNWRLNFSFWLLSRSNCIDAFCSKLCSDCSKSAKPIRALSRLLSLLCDNRLYIMLLRLSDRLLFRLCIIFRRLSLLNFLNLFLLSFRSSLLFRLSFLSRCRRRCISRLSMALLIIVNALQESRCIKLDVFWHSVDVNTSDDAILIALWNQRQNTIRDDFAFRSDFILKLCTKDIAQTSFKHHQELL